MVNLIVGFIAILFPAAGLAAEPSQMTDPTAPAHFAGQRKGPTESTSLPVLNSIVIRGTSRSAIINNTLYQQGDTVLGYKLVRITPDLVTLKGQGRQIQLSMYNTKILK